MEVCQLGLRTTLLWRVGLTVKTYPGSREARGREARGREARGREARGTEAVVPRPDIRPLTVGGDAGTRHKTTIGRGGRKDIDVGIDILVAGN